MNWRKSLRSLQAEGDKLKTTRRVDLAYSHFSGFWFVFVTCQVRLASEQQDDIGLMGARDVSEWINDLERSIIQYKNL